MCRLRLFVVVVLVLARGGPSLAAVLTDTANTNTTTTAADSVPSSTPSSASSPPHPRCRTFFAHGDTAAKDGAEYSAVLLWREHAVLDAATATWTLAVNVTATEGARIMLGSAARALPGQPHYELVLGATTGGSRLRVHAAASVASTAASKLRLFEEGDLQVWLRWRLAGGHAAAAASTALLEVSVLPAGGAAPTLLFSYNTSKPIQLETFSFGSSTPGDVAFTVCTSGGGAAPGGDRVASNVTEHHHGGALGVPGCRSLLVHVQSSHANVHNLAVGWSETADQHGRLQFWARASTDVEVEVSERLHLRRGDPKYRVVFGGDFNSHTWAVSERGARVAVADTPALLSDFQYRPLWLSVSPHAVLAAGTGELHNDHNHTTGHGGHGDQGSHRLLAWTHPHGPSPMFVSFATFRQRQVHFLIDCVESPSRPGAAATPPFPADLRDVVRNSVASSLASPARAAPALLIDVERLALHNGTLSASGTLVQELRHTGGLKWNPDWFDGVKKIQFWPTDEEGFEGGRELNKPSIAAFRSDAKGKARLETGPIEVDAKRKIRWNFPISLKMPCIENEAELVISCSISFQLNSSSEAIDFQTKTSEDFERKWKTEWHIVPTIKTNNSIITLKVTSINHRKLNQAVSPPYTLQSRHAGLLSTMSIILIITALITIMSGNKQLTSHRYSQYILKQISVWPKKFSEWPGKDIWNRHAIVGYEGDTVQIMHLDSETSQIASHENQEPSQFHSKELCEQKEHSFLRMLLVVALLISSLFLSILDLYMR